MPLPITVAILLVVCLPVIIISSITLIISRTLILLYLAAMKQDIQIPTLYILRKHTTGREISIPDISKNKLSQQKFCSMLTH